MAERSAAVDKQCSAFLAWLDTLSLDISGVSTSSSMVHDSIEAYYDPIVLAAVLKCIDNDVFGNLDLDAAALEDDDMDEGEADEQQRLRRLQTLLEAIITYFSDNLRLVTSELPQIDLHAIAGQENDGELCTLLSLITALAVLSSSKEKQIMKIQSTPEWVQRELMICIESVRSKLSSPDPSADFNSSQFTLPQSPSAQSLLSNSAHATLQASYEQLKREMQVLRSEHEDTLEALKQAEARARDSDEARATKSASARSADLDRLRSELTRTEATLAETEATSTQQGKSIEELTRRVEELSAKASQAEMLHDQLDEYRHRLEKSRKLEAQIDRYKKKLEESAETRKLLKELEEENLTLMEKNAELEEEFKTAKDYKPLLDQYKATLGEHEAKGSLLLKEKQDLTFRLEQASKELSEHKDKLEGEKQTIALLEERVRELELAGRKSLGTERQVRTDGRADQDVPDSSEDDNDLSGMANEIGDALSGRTRTDLKLHIRKLERELQASKANKTDASRIVVLEDLLEDSRKTKARYEQDYLQEHRAKLIAQKMLEDIRSGAAVTNNDAEVATALRIRLDEVMSELDKLKKAHMSLEERCRTVEKELAVARSDLTLVDKDRVEVLKALRVSVSVENQNLEQELKASKSHIGRLEQTCSMQLSQINSLLMDKVELQHDGLTQRERLLQERETKSGAHTLINASELESLRTELQNSRDELDQTKEKLHKARNFIRQQDKLFKEQHAAAQEKNESEALETAYKLRIGALEADLERQRDINAGIEQRYQKEQSLMLSAWQEVGMQNMRSQVALNGQQARYPPVSWLAQQRARTLERSLR